MAVDTQITITTAEPGPATTLTESSSLFVVDATPSASQNRVPVPTYDIHPHTVSLGESANVKVEVEPNSEDDVIVYDAPNPRISTPRVKLTALTNISVPNHTPSSTPRQINPLRKGKFVHVVGRNAKRSSGGILGVKRKKLCIPSQRWFGPVYHSPRRLRKGRGLADKTTEPSSSMSDPIDFSVFRLDLKLGTHSSSPATLVTSAERGSRS